MQDHRELLRDLREPSQSLRAAYPAVSDAFASLHEAAVADGEVPTRIKEVVAMVIGVVKNCDRCIAYHARAAARAGATPGEVAELLAVATLMDGGPATMNGPIAWQAYQEFHGGAGGGPGQS